jgi:multiple sugar transport system permease protein
MNIEEIRSDWPHALLNVLTWVALILFLAFLILPIYNGFLISITPIGSLGERGLLPIAFEWQNYVEVFDAINLQQQLFNSTLYAVSITVLNLLVTVPAGYALSRFEFRGKTTFLFLLLLTQMFAAIVILPSLYTLIRSLGLINSYASVILTVGAITIPLSTFLLKGFFDSLPIEIEEAAMVDGCSRIQILRQVILPVSLPGILTAATFTFIVGFQNFLIPLIMITDESKLPVTVGIFNMFGEMAPPHHFVMAATFIGIAPIILLYVLAQDYIIEGLTEGGAKG